MSNQRLSLSREAKSLHRNHPRPKSKRDARRRHTKQAKDHPQVWVRVGHNTAARSQRCTATVQTQGAAHRCYKKARIDQLCKLHHPWSN